MVRYRNTRHGVRVNAIVNSGRKLGRSLLLMAHYITVLVNLISSSVNCVVGVFKWTSMFARYTVAAFDSVQRTLNWWTGRCGGDAIEMLSGSDAESE